MKQRWFTAIFLLTVSLLISQTVFAETDSSTPGEERTGRTIVPLRAPLLKIPRSSETKPPVEQQIYRDPIDYPVATYEEPPQIDVNRDPIPPPPLEVKEPTRHNPPVEVGVSPQPESKSPGDIHRRLRKGTPRTAGPGFLPPATSRRLER